MRASLRLAEGSEVSLGWMSPRHRRLGRRDRAARCFEREMSAEA